MHRKAGTQPLMLWQHIAAEPIGVWDTAAPVTTIGDDTMPMRPRTEFFGEDDEPDPAVTAAIELMSDGRDHRCLAHALISAGLFHLRGKLCDQHVIEELEFLHRS